MHAIVRDFDTGFAQHINDGLDIGGIATTTLGRAANIEFHLNALSRHAFSEDGGIRQIRRIGANVAKLPEPVRKT